MYFTWLRSFDAVCREGGFTAAAKRLNVSQSTITSQIKAIEERFGVELFFRRGRKVVLTTEGRQLFGISQDLMGSYDEAVRFLTPTSSGQFRLSGVGPPLVLELAEAFSEKFPAIQLSVNVDNGERVLNDLNEFRCDVALLAQHEKESRFHAVPYQRYPIVAFVNTDHPWRNRRSVKIEEFSGQSMVLRDLKSKTRENFDLGIQKNRVKLGDVLEVNSRETMREAVLHGFGIGIINSRDFIPDRRLRMVKISHPDLNVPFYVTCLTRRKNRPLISAFFKVAAGLRRGI